MKILLIFLNLALIIGVFYFSWLPDSELKSETYLPNWVLKWCNEYYNIRTAVPFILFGLVLEIRSGLQVSVTKNSSIYNALWSTLIIIIAEVGQYFTKERHPDIYDIFYGIIGTFIGIFLYYITFKLIKKIKNA